MSKDPYIILGISKDATPEEIKRAYRKKAKEYHPDLHPNDKYYEQKMAEVNEAYDMLINPSKYQNKNQNQYQQKQNNYDAYGFDFSELFNFSNQKVELYILKDDSEEIKKAISLIKNNRLQDSIEILNNVVSTNRNHRWYFISAYANNLSGKNELAFEQIKKAVELNPNNQEYQRFYKQLYYKLQSQHQNINVKVTNPITILLRLGVYILIFRFVMLLFQFLLYRGG